MNPPREAPASAPSLLKKIGLGCGGLLALIVVVVLGLAFAQPDTFRIARSTTMNRPLGALRAVVLDVERFDGVMYSTPQSGPYTSTYSASRSGIGASLERARGADRARYTIIAIDEGGVTYEVDVNGGANTIVRFDLTMVDPARTAVTVSIEGPLDTFLKRVLWPFVNLEGRVGPDLEATLRALDEAAR